MTGRYACQVRLPYFNDQIRAALAAEAIIETYPRTSPEPDSTTSTEVRVAVPGDTESQARLNLIEALMRARIEFQPPSGWQWHEMSADWDG